MPRRFTRADVQFHGIGYGYTVTPAVNVKVYASPTAADYAAAAGETGLEDGGFTEAWAEAHVSDADRSEYWNQACGDAWERLQEDLDNDPIFGVPVVVASEGRSSGWAILYRKRTPDPRNPRQNPCGALLFDSERAEVARWDAVAITRWGKFARRARAHADDVPYLYCWLLAEHAYRPWREEQTAQHDAAETERRLNL